MQSVKKYLNKITAAVLSVLLLVTSVPLTAFGTENTSNGVCGENAAWTLDENGILTVSGSGEMQSYDKAVDSPWYESRNLIKSVVIENGIESIGNRAFMLCDKLEYVEIPASIIMIGTQAFMGCDSLFSVKIPDTVLIIGLSAFGYDKDNSRVEDFAIIGNMDTAAKSYADENGFAFRSAENVSDEDDESATEEIYTDDPSDEILTDGSLNENITWTVDDSGVLTIYGNGDIPDFSIIKTDFLGWDDYAEIITSIVINEGITGIGFGCFASLKNLQSVSIPDTVTKIKALAFADCINLLTMEIPASVDEIEDYAFGYVMNEYNGYCLKAVDNITITGAAGTQAQRYAQENDFVFEESSTCLHIGQTTQKAARSADCTDVGYSDGIQCNICGAYISGHDITQRLPHTDSDNDGFCDSCDSTFVTASGECGENATWKVDLNGQLTISGTGELYESDFYIWTYYLLNIKKCVIEAGITSIPPYAFQLLLFLNEVEIADTVTSIGSSAFCDNINLMYVNIPASVTNIEERAFGYLTAGETVDGFVILGDNGSAAQKYAQDNGFGFSNYCLHNTTKTTVAQTEPTCLKYGYTAGEKCDNCSAFLSGHKKINKINHIDSDNDELCDVCEKSVLLGSGSCGENVQWKLYDNGLLKIYGTGSITDYNDFIDVPWYNFKEMVQRVEIEEGITRIGINAFAYCYSLESVTIPDGVTEIGEIAFEHCTSLKEIEFPVSLTVIDTYAFSGCFGLKHIEIPENVKTLGAFAFYECKWLTDIIVDESNTVYDSRNNCNAIIETETNTLIFGCVNSIIPDDVTQIGEYAFRNCVALKSITIPDGVTYLGNNAFAYCNSLKSVNIAGSVDSINYNCFAFCTNLTQVTINNGVKKIYERAFFNCTSLKSITIPESVTLINSESLGYTKAGKAEITVYGVIGSAAQEYADDNGLIFISSCHHENTTDTPEQPTACNAYGYTAGVKCEDCGAYVDGHERIEKLPHTDNDNDGICDVCKNYTDNEIDIGERKTVEIIDGQTLYIKFTPSETATYTFTTADDKYINDTYGFLCDADKNLLISDDDSAGNGNFKIIYRLVEGKTYYLVAKYWFDERTGSYDVILIKNCNHTDADNDGICDSCGAEFIVAKGECSEDISWTIDTDKTLTISRHGEIPDYSEITISAPWLKYSDSIENVTIENGITRIGTQSFTSCHKIKNVDIPDSVESIGDYAFENCEALADIEIPKNVTNIGERVLINCYALKKITVDAQNAVYDSRNNCNAVIETDSNTLLFGCINTVIPDSVVCIGRNSFFNLYELAEITIPDGVNRIEFEAFAYCYKLTKIEIPESVTWISENAFAGSNKIESIVVDENNTNYDSRNNCNAVIETETNTLLFGCKNTVIPEGITEIARNAFSECVELTEIVIPDGVQKINSNAFYGCEELTSVTIPGSVTSIGNTAFGYIGSEKIEDFVIYGAVGSAAQKYADDNGFTFLSTCNHENTTDIPEQPATCSAYGYTAGVKCEDCGAYIYGHEKTKKLPHTDSDNDEKCDICHINLCNEIVIGERKTVEIVDGQTVYIKFIPTETGSYIFTTADDQYLDDTYGYLYDADKKLIIGNDDDGDNNNFKIEYQLNAGETYYFGAGYFSDKKSGSYDVILTKDCNHIDADDDGKCDNCGIDFIFAQGNCGDYLYWKLKLDGTLTIFGQGEMYDYNSCFDTPWFDYTGKITHIIIETGATSISDYAFNRCSALTELEISDSVERIGYCAFEQCSRIEKIDVSDRNTVYDSRNNCNAVIQTNTNTLILGCRNTVIPNDTVCIGAYAFSYCYNMTSIEIPDSVTTIEMLAFYNCRSLTKIEIPAGVEQINYNAFQGCGAVTAISVDAANTVYDSRNNCNAVINTESNTLIKGCANTVIPADVECIGENAFGECDGLENIEIPESVTHLGYSAFRNCISLTKIDIPASINTVNAEAFINCASLSHVTLAQGIEYISENAFYGCNSMTYITIPESVSGIGYMALGYNNNGEKIEDFIIYGIIGSAAQEYADDNGFTFISSCPHENTTDMPEQPAACNAYGYTAGVKCEVCGAYIDGHERIEKLPHTDDDNDKICDACNNYIDNEIVIGERKTVEIVDEQPVYIRFTPRETASYTFTTADDRYLGDTFGYLYDAEKTQIICDDDDAGNYNFKINYYLNAGETYYFGAGYCSSRTGSYDVILIKNCNHTDADNDGICDSCGVNYVVEYGTCGENASWALDIYGLLTISGQGEASTATWHNYNDDIVDIKIKDGITGIGEDLFSGCYAANSIQIADTVESIGSRAFEGCNALKSIKITKNVSSIGNDALVNCKNLASIVVDEQNTTYDSRNNSNAVIETETNTLLFGCKNTVIPDNVTAIGRDAFYACIYLSDIVIPNSVTRIDDYAFFYCSSLNKLEIPDSVTSISGNAFRNCEKLESIVVDENNTKYDSRNNCNAVIETETNTLILGCRNTVIPDSVTCIGSYAFGNIYELTDLKIPFGVTKIGENAFSSCGLLNEITFPDSLIEIGNYSFSYCEDITGITIPGSVKLIDHNAFRKCVSLTNLTISEGVQRIEEYAFFDCESLTSVQIPVSVTEIGKYAFGYDGACEKIENFIIYGIIGSVAQKYADDNGFTFISSCPHENTTDIPEQPATCNAYGYTAGVICEDCCAFIDGHERIEKLPHTDDDNDKICEACNNYIDNEIVIGERKTVEIVDEQTVYIKFTPSETAEYTFTTADDRHLGDTYGYLCDANKVTIVEDDDSAGNGNFKIEYRLNAGVTYYLGTRYYDSEESGSYDVILTKGCTHIDADDDGKCDNCGINLLIARGACGDSTSWTLDIYGLLSIRGQGKMSDYYSESYVPWYEYRYAINNIIISNKITSIGDLSFSGCCEITNIKIPDSVVRIGNAAFSNCYDLKKIEIPENVTVIGEYAFYDCSSLSEITIPGSVKEIECYAFNKCSSLTSVTISNGTESINEGAFLSCIGVSSITIPVSVKKIEAFALGYFNRNTKIEYYTINGVLYSAANNYASENGFDFSSSCNHDNAVFTVKTMPTCEEAGVTKYICNECGFEYEIIDIPSTGHNYTGETKSNGNGKHSYKCVNGCGKYGGTVECEYESSTKTPATCENNGVTKYICTACAYSYEATNISATGHNYTGETKSNGNGTHSYKCVNGCGKYGGTVDCEYESSIKTPATCENNGVTKYICTACAYSYEATNISATGHNYTGETKSNGNGTHSYKCVNGCGKYGNTVDCEYESSIKTPATCENNGVTKYICTTCVYSYEATNIPATGHNYTSEHITTPDGTDGYTEYTCTRCKNAYTVYDPAEAVESFTAYATVNAVNLSWLKSIQASVTGYKIYRKTADDESYSLLAEISSRNTLAYIDRDVIVGTEYFYVICAMKGKVEGYSTQPVSAAALPDTDIPVVTSVSPKNGSTITGTVNIKAEAEDNVAVTRLTVFYSVDEGETWVELKTVNAAACNVPFDTTVLKDGRVKVKVVAYDALNNASDGSPVRTYLIDNTAPAVVESLTAISVYTTQLTLSWANPSDKDTEAFVLQQKHNDEIKTLASGITTLGYNVNSLSPSTSYEYRVAAVDAVGNVGKYSEWYTVTTQDDTYAPVITAQSPPASRFNKSIMFSATATDDYAVKKITVQYSFDKSNWIDINTKTFNSVKAKQSSTFEINLTEFDDGDIYVRAIAEDFFGNISITDDTAPFIQYVVDTTAPQKPKYVNAKGADGYIVISWEQGSESDLGTYSVYRADSADEEYRLIASDLSAVSYNDRDVNREQIYYYKVSVNDTAENMSEQSDFVTACAVKDDTKPNVESINPTSESNIGMNSRNVSVLFSDNCRLFSAVIEYKTSLLAPYEALTRSDNINNYYAVVTAQLDLDGLENGDTVYIRAYCTDESGNTSEKVTATYTVDNQAPSAENITLTKNVSTITLVWNDASESDLSAFKVYRSQDNAEYTLIGSRSSSDRHQYTFIDQPDYGTVTYRIDAIDTAGNIAEFYTDNITIQKEAVLNAVIDTVSYFETNVQEIFSAENSISDEMITSFAWDFGDGTYSDKAAVTKAYDKAGEYTIKLTVTDALGNENSVQKVITVNERKMMGTAKVRVVDENGKAVAYTPVYFDLGDSNQQVVYTDASGYAIYNMSVGTHNVGAYKNGYLPSADSINILTGETGELTLTIREQELITGEFEVHEMNFEEIVAAGIDINDPANQQIYKVNVVLTYQAVNIPVTYIRNNQTILSAISASDIGGIGGGSGSSGSGSSSGGGYPNFHIEFIPNEPNQEIIAVMEIPATVSYLKQFYSANLYVLNNAAQGFDIINCDAQINAPQGLTVVQSTPIKKTIGGGETAYAGWILRGDKAGNYDLSADFSGTLDRFNVPVSATFVAKNSVCVYGAESIEIVVESPEHIFNNLPEDTTVSADEYEYQSTAYINFGVKNVSERVLYNVKSSIDTDETEIKYTLNDGENITEESFIARIFDGSKNGTYILDSNGERKEVPYNEMIML